MKEKFSGTAVTGEISLFGGLCMLFRCTVPHFKLSIANRCHVEIHTRLCAIVRRVVIKIGLLNHCTKDAKEGVFFFLKKGTQRNGPTVSNVLEITRL